MADNGCNCRWCSYDREFAARIQHVPEKHRAFFEALKEDWEATHHEVSRLSSYLTEEDAA